MWTRQPGFPTLIHIILEQQVSLASAKAAFDRLLATTPSLTPERFLELDNTTLRTIGFSRQKAECGHQIATAIQEGRLDLVALGTMDDATARAELIKLKGIGPWTAEVYLLIALRRPDVWPIGDLALAAAVQRIKGFARRPTKDELEEIGAAWRPWRAIAARTLWHYYLHN
jgi:DNA-3-methyladenine glycosylase II